MITLTHGGRIWITETGQSDFTQQIIQLLTDNGTSVPKDQIVLVQYSEWNEKETIQDALAFVKPNTTYVKVPDGNTNDNGSSGFKAAQFKVKNLENNQLKNADVWREANKVSSQYNSINGRYRNEEIDIGGADFSDLVEVVWILGITDVDTVKAFFAKFNTNN